MAPLQTYFTRLKIVRQLPIFAKLNWIDVQRIAAKARLEEHRKGDIICEKGKPSDYFYCLVSGRLQAYTRDDSGRKENIEFIHRGTHFGVVAILTGELQSATFEALNDSVILKIPKNDFQAILNSVPQLGVELSQTLSQRIHKRQYGRHGVVESTIISVYSPVKGTGSSTYSANLAISLARETKKKVILVNIHPNDRSKDGKDRRELSKSWKILPVDLGEIVGDDEKIQANIRKDELGMDLMHITFDPEHGEITRQISPFVSSLVGNYHYLVVDMPNEMDDVVLETLTQSDVVHLVTNDRAEDLTLIRKVVDQLEVRLKENFREEKIKVIIRAKEAKIYLSFEEINKFIDYHVYTMIPFIQPEDVTVSLETENLSVLKPHESTEYAKTIRHIAREIGKVLVGVVLGGGAALGVAHIGVIRVLEKENIPVDVIVGSSMGALVGSLWAIGKNSDELEKVAAEFPNKQSMLKLFDPVLPISGLVGGHLIRRWLRSHLGSKTFYGCKIPFKVVTYDLVRREEIIINSGSLVDAVRKSIAIPGVVEPIKIDDQVLIDGGVLNPLPTNVLAAMGIKKIIAVNVLQSPEHVHYGFEQRRRKLREKLDVPFSKDPLNYIGVRLQTGLGKALFPNIADIIVQTLQATEYVIAQQSAHDADVTIHPDLAGINWFELDAYPELIKRGEEAARRQLPEILSLINE